ncbi:MAG: peroxiredoxin [bacterium]|nr:peroxiredoxin [bacterium]
MLLPGQKFPEMEVHTTHGKLKLPLKQWFVLFTHPADFTPVCTTEFVEFARMYELFKELGCELIGLSLDQVYSHVKWMEWIRERLGYEIPFPIIADPEGKVARTLGILGDGLPRAVLVVDKEDRVRASLVYPPKVGRNVQEIFRLVLALKTADEQGVATPANWWCDRLTWKSSTVVGNALIIPPASTLQEKEEREKKKQRGEIHCLDWWFCWQE